MASPTVEPLTSRSARVKTARGLANRSSRRESGLFLIEGAKTLAEALRRRDCVVEVFATTAASERHPDLRAEVIAAGLPWRLTADPAVRALSATVTPQGVVAVCRTFDVPLEGVMVNVPEESLLVICASVRDPGNAGTIIRTADAAGARAVVLAGESVDLYNDKTVRATVGSLFHLPISQVLDVAGAVLAARSVGYRILAADGDGEVDLFNAGDLLAGRVAWLFGNEAWGLPDELAELADHRVAIPILGRAESLNLASAAAVCLYASAGRQAGMDQRGTMFR